jgi:uncharacterized membrane protein YdjX (TVP38/TMEM64 family)
MTTIGLKDARLLKLAVIIVWLVAMVVLPFVLWGDSLEALFTGDGAIQTLRGSGASAAVIAIGLLIADLLVPIPAAAVMAALGIVYGPVLGGLIAVIGSFLSGVVGYAICRKLGRPAALWIMGNDALDGGERIFNQFGGWLVAASRWVPVLPEVISCLAGLTRMPLATYLAALLCGAVPVGFTFALVGYLGADSPVLTIAFCAVAPLLLWAVVHRMVRRMAISTL